jgi:hypothetical protein
MGTAIKAIRYAGLTLADFRGKSKSERSFMWMLVVANIEWDQTAEYAQDKTDSRIELL